MARARTSSSRAARPYPYGPCQGRSERGRERQRTPFLVGEQRCPHLVLVGSRRVHHGQPARLRHRSHPARCGPGQGGTALRAEHRTRPSAASALGRQHQVGEVLPPPPHDHHCANTGTYRPPLWTTPCGQRGQASGGAARGFGARRTSTRPGIRTARGLPVYGVGRRPAGVRRRGGGLPVYGVGAEACRWTLHGAGLPVHVRRRHADARRRAEAAGSSARSDGRLSASRTARRKPVGSVQLRGRTNACRLREPPGGGPAAPDTTPRTPGGSARRPARGEPCPGQTGPYPG